MYKKTPDIIDFSQIELFRLIGTTRVQVGVQSTNDNILRKINRKCTSAQNKQGIRRLKQNGFKTDIHIMYDLPVIITIPTPKTTPIDSNSSIDFKIL